MHLETLPAVALDAGAELFSCTWRDARGAKWATLAGELDACTAPQLEQGLREAEAVAELIVVDLRGLTFMDCSGTSVIVESSDRVRHAGGRLVVVRGPQAVDMLFALTGTEAVMDVFDLQPAEPAVQVLLQIAVTATALPGG